MATVVHEHTTDRNNSSGTIIAVILLALIAILFLVYGLPAIQSASTPQVSVPDKVDVNVNTPQN